MRTSRKGDHFVVNSSILNPRDTIPTGAFVLLQSVIKALSEGFPLFSSLTERVNFTCRTHLLGNSDA